MTTSDATRPCPFDGPDGDPQSSRDWAYYPLPRLMSAISEQLYNAGWHLAIAHQLWHALEGGSRRIGRHEVSTDELVLLATLARVSGFWWRPCNDPGRNVEAVPLAEWQSYHNRAETTAFLRTRDQKPPSLATEISNLLFRHQSENWRRRLKISERVEMDVAEILKIVDKRPYEIGR